MLMARPVAAQAAIRLGLADLVHVGEDRQTGLALDLRKDAQALIQPGAPKGVAAAAIRLVEGGLEYQRQAMAIGDALDGHRALHGGASALEHVEARDQGERLAVAQVNVSNAHGSPSPRRGSW
jgi:hypothetical protein